MQSDCPTWGWGRVFVASMNVHGNMVQGIVSSGESVDMLVEWSRPVVWLGSWKML